MKRYCRFGSSASGSFGRHSFPTALGTQANPSKQFASDSQDGMHTFRLGSGEHR